MDDLQIIQPSGDAQVVATISMQQAGKIANEIAADNIFTDYRSRKSERTLAAHDDDLGDFTRFLSNRGVRVEGELNRDSGAWAGVTWGLVDGYIKWLMNEHYAMSTVNRRLSSIKRYVTLAAKTVAVDLGEAIKIKDMASYSYKDARNINKARGAANQGRKKPVPTLPTLEQALRLKRNQPDTPQGKRDALLMCLLLDHGLRCGEAASLEVSHFDLAHRKMTFYREKVHQEQTHDLTDDTLSAILAYLYGGGPKEGSLWYATNRYKQLAEHCLTTRGIYKRVGTLGELVGIPDLSPHDCRHYWATSAILAGTDVKALQDAGGWNSPAMPLRYVESSKIANDRVKLMGQRKD